MGPCEDWPLNPACSQGIEVDPEAQTPLERFAVRVASRVLWRATAGLFGVCEVTVRPCGRNCGNSGFTYWPVQNVAGEWINVTCGCAGSAFGCCSVSEIKLDSPVAGIVEILIDGAVVDPATYRLDNGYRLTRVFPGEPWPKCQDLSKPATEPGTFQITYLHGIPLDDQYDAQFAVAAYAKEIINACEGSDCRLPARVQEITRQGITVGMVNDLDFLQSGLTNIPEVDAWITSVNPTGQRSQSAVWSPDMQPTLRYMG